ncbi:outer membrane protein [Zhengella sp. ZM62]|uniref:outer membrane protein n=1 Tax=Zhengella sedimenti TaxID=3390035 RepID=UPI00397527E9
MKNVNLKILALIGAMSLPLSAQAADMAYDTASVSWTGFYGGVHAGYGFGQGDITNSSPPGPPTRTIGVDMDGFLGGVQIGYNWQASDTMVFGIVGDFSLAGIGGTFVNVPPPGPPFTVTSDINWMATLRARAGYLVQPETLLYAHGGLAVADIDATWTRGAAPGGPGPFRGIGSNTEIGWTIGAGVEHMLSDKVSLFAEYAYADFGTARFANTTGPAINYSQDVSIHTIKFGLNYRF